MTPATVFVSKPAKRASPWSSWTTMSPVRRSANERSSPRPRRVGRSARPRRWISRCSGIAASFSGGQTKPSRRLASANTSPAVLRLPARPQPLQVVGGALALAALRPRDERRVARARELLELRLGLVERAGGELGRLRAELERLRARDRGQPQRLARLERRHDRGRRDVEVVRVGVVEGGAVTSSQWSRSDGSTSSSAAITTSVCSGKRSSSSRKRSTGSSSATSGRLVGVLERGDLGQLAVLGGELGGGRDLDPLRPRPASAG